MGWPTALLIGFAVCSMADETHALSWKQDKNRTKKLAKVVGSREEPTDVVFLNGHIVQLFFLIIMHISKHLCSSQPWSEKLLILVFSD